MCEDDRRLDDYFEIFKDLIIRYAKSYVGDYYIAEDICQETFLKLYGYMGRLDERGVKRWLYVVSYNKTCDWIRRSKKYHELIEENSDLLVRGADDPVDRYAAFLDDTDWCNHILRKVREKNEKWYEILILFDYFGIPKR